MSMCEGKLVIFGGGAHPTMYNDLWMYDTMKNRWEPIKPIPESPTPSARYAHSGLLFPDSSLNGELVLLVYGGRASDELGDVWKFRFNSLEWTPIRCEGDIPLPRHGHSMCAINGVVYCFGGKTAQGCSDSLYKLECSSRFDQMTWKKIAAPGGPSARYAHSSVTNGSKMYIFGGGIAPISYGDIFVFDALYEIWSPISMLGVDFAARSYHAACALPSGMMVFGGTDWSNYLNDTAFFEFSTRRWHHVEASSTIPAPRFGCSLACQYTSSSSPASADIYLFGGGGGALYNDVHRLRIHHSTTIPLIVPPIRPTSVAAPSIPARNTAAPTAEPRREGEMHEDTASRQEVDALKNRIQLLEAECARLQLHSIPKSMEEISTLHESQLEALQQDLLLAVAIVGGARVSVLKKHTEARLDELNRVNLGLVRRLASVDRAKKPKIGVAFGVANVREFERDGFPLEFVGEYEEAILSEKQRRASQR